jgi:DNA replication protein DnaC
MVCLRPEVARLAPPESRWCPRHGKAKVPVHALYPLEGAEYEAAEQRAWAVLSAKFGVPPLYRWASFAKADPTPAITAARSYAGGFDDDDDDWEYLDRAMILEGAVGCGKTTALYAFLRHRAVENARIDGEDQIHFFPFPKLIGLLLNAELRDDTMEACINADELIIDDWGSSYVKRDGFAQGIIEEIVVHREAHEMAMLASTNLSPKDFRQMFGERVYDRLRGRWGAWIRCAGSSLRGKRAVHP